MLDAWCLMLDALPTFDCVFELFASCDEFLKISRRSLFISYIVSFLHSCFLNHSKYKHCLINLSDFGGIIGVRSTCLIMETVRIFACFTVWIIVVHNGCVFRLRTAHECTFDMGDIWCNRKYINRLSKMGLDVIVFSQFRCFFSADTVYVNFPVVFRFSISSNS